MQGMIEIMDEVGFEKYDVELFFVKNYLIIQQKTFLNKPIYIKVSLEDIQEVNVSKVDDLPKITLTTKKHLVHITENGSLCIMKIAQFVLQAYMNVEKQSA
ncbi:hypothetical protein ACWOFR_08810 [Carnobacterium gallinarum]|uniref:hypothetical protein n=1 Tax=Carnobacterium gallinarum TaxID=2749 RepID=UPI0005579A2B|nr:hypothetical protein [Carnobacterium gallinarum]